MDNCCLTADHIEILGTFAQNQKTLQFVSLNSNPNEMQNFHLLLLNTNVLVLSLKFCEITCTGIQNIANVLSENCIHPLLHLNLASNYLFDKGMQYVANILRINRNILSINLTDNKIRTNGLSMLLQPLTKFRLRQDEIQIRRKFKFEYYKKTVSLSSMIY